MVNSIGIIEVGFQAQSYTFYYSTSIEEILTDLYHSQFSFTNSNPVFTSTNLDGYAISGQAKNFTIVFKDEEGDIVFTRSSSTSGLSVFISSSKKIGTYNVLCQSLNDNVSRENITFVYYDKYHTDPIYWSKITLFVDVFLSDPPRFSEDLNNFTVNA